MQRAEARLRHLPIQSMMIPVRHRTTAKKAEETPAEEPVEPNKPAEEPDAGGKTETPTEEDKTSETGTDDKADGTEKETESEDKPAAEEQNQEQ